MNLHHAQSTHKVDIKRINQTNQFSHSISVSIVSIVETEKGRVLKGII